MNKSKIKFSYLTIILVTLILLLLSSSLSIFISSNNFSVLTNNVNDIKDTKDNELYNSSTGNFNNEVMSDLLEKLFGNQDPVKYIKTMQDSQTGSFVIPAKTINAKIGNSNGISVILGGLEWTVTSLTLADIDGEEDVVLTLLLSEPNGTSIYYTNESNTKGNNAYCRSVIRNHLLTDEKWSLFNQTGEESFASQYLVQPKNIKYQHNQSQKDRGTYKHHLPNEALDEFKANWNASISYKPSDEFADPNGNMVRYDAWGDDYIWLPSMTEAGSVNRASTTSIWQLSTEQLVYNSASTSWYRSADVSGYAYVYTMSPNGDTGAEYPKSLLGVRPAIHLNLSSVAKGLDNPQDLVTKYNKNGQTIKSIATETKASWYDSDIYENTANYINITYPNSMTELKEVGEYWVKIEITENYINAIYQQVEKEGADKGWSQDYIEQIKEKRKPKFRGTADNTDSNHLESDTIRWIKVTIEKAEVDFSRVKWSADKLEYNAFNQSVKIIEGLPSFVTVKYSDYSKKEVGVYTAQVIEMTCSDSNYKVPKDTELANYPTLKHTWEITKKKIITNWKYESISQNGVTIAKPVLNVDKSILNSIEYTYYKDSNMTQKITLDEIFAEFDITEVNTYWVKATFKSTGDFNSNSCIFVCNGVESAELQKTMETGTTSNSVKVDIVNSKVTFNGSEQIANFTVSGGGLTEDALVIEYRKQDGTILQTAPINAGFYKVIVSLKDELTDFIITGITEFDFEIESLKIKKPLANQKQFYQANGFSLSDIANLPNDWKKYFSVKAYDKNNNEILSENDNWKFVNVNTYNIEISFKAGTNTANGGVTDNVVWSDSDKNTFIVGLEIIPLVFSMDGWQDGTGNKKPVVTGKDVADISNYFDYIIYELKNGIIVGNMLPQNATLKFNTDYQISLKVKDEFSGNVFVEYNGETISETEPYNFKTQVNPNPDGDTDNEGEGNGTGGGNGSSINGGANLWFGENGKLPLFAWVLIASNLLTILLLIILVIALLRSRNNKDKFTRVAPTVTTTNNNDSNDTNQIINDNTNNSFVNADLMNNSDWTFIVREKDVLNIKALENQNERILMYACKESEVKKLKKFQNAIDEVKNDFETDAEKQKDVKTNKKKKK